MVQFSVKKTYDNPIDKNFKLGKHQTLVQLKLNSSRTQLYIRPYCDMGRHRWERQGAVDNCQAFRTKSGLWQGTCHTDKVP